MYFEVRVTGESHFVIEAESADKARGKIENLGPTYHGWEIIQIHRPQKLSTIDATGD